MEKTGVSKLYDDLPIIVKGIYAVSALAIFGIIGYSLYKKYHKTQSEKDAEESVKESMQDIKTISQHEKQSYIYSQYKAFADALFEAMSGVGTDDDAINSVFNKMKNTIDVLTLIKAFGIRDYTDDKVFVFNIKPMNLNQWISAELSNNEKTTLNNILKSKKIKYQF